MTIRQLSRLLRKSHRLTHSWRLTGSEFGIGGALAFRIATQGLDPVSPDIRQRLSLGPRPCSKCHRMPPTPRIKRTIIMDEPIRRVLTGAWKVNGSWVGPEEAFGAGA